MVWLFVLFLLILGLAYQGHRSWAIALAVANGLLAAAIFWSHLTSTLEIRL